MDDKTYRVEVQPDFLQKLSRVSQVTGLAELIWNALDADATQIDVTIDDAVLGSELITVRDNGTGFSYEEAPDLFSNLGNSWKRLRGTSYRDGRYLHGAEGQGRFKALSLGRVVNWRVVHPVAAKRFNSLKSGFRLMLHLRFMSQI